MITRHFIDVGSRRVHYRRAGTGPALLLVHQSPRSSAEYEPLMTRWAAHFTCIAPDSPGYGQSDPLPQESPDIGHFADATLDFVAALGLGPVGAYGFHSGAIILMTALRRRPQAFTALGLGGYAVWTPAERALFGAAYLPAFEPSGYGEHLTWVWNRIMEQSWYFPWFQPGDSNRMSGANDDPVYCDATVRDMLASGPHYRSGYGAVMAAPRDIPDPDATVPPVLIAAYDGDPLQAHIDRLGAMPAGWSARKLATPPEFEAAMLAHLIAHPAAAPGAMNEAGDEGFLHVVTAAYDGLIHWRGRGPVLHVHAPGDALDPLAGGVAIDLPGHGLSDAWPGEAPAGWQPWREVIEAVCRHFGLADVVHALGPDGDPERLFPDLTPDRFGAHLTRAWGIARARAVFAPWYSADAAHARPVDLAALAPDRLAVDTLNLLRATAARAYMLALGERDGNS